MTDIVVMRHVRELRYCAAGTRAFFKANGLDWVNFIKNGIPAEELEATGDAMAIKLAEVSRGLK